MSFSSCSSLWPKSFDFGAPRNCDFSMRPRISWANAPATCWRQGLLADLRFEQRLYVGLSQNRVPLIHWFIIMFPIKLPFWGVDPIAKTNPLVMADYGWLWLTMADRWETPCIMYCVKWIRMGWLGSNTQSQAKQSQASMCWLHVAVQDGYIDKDELYFVLDRVGTFKKAKWSLAKFLSILCFEHLGLSENRVYPQL